MSIQENQQYDQEELTNLVTQIVAEVTGKKLPNAKTELASEGIDSMAKLDILATLEKNLHLELNESSIEEFVTINRITTVIQDAIRATKCERSAQSITTS